MIFKLLSLVILTTFFMATAQGAYPDFKQVFSSHSSVMFLIDPETGQIINANKAASSFYGYTVSELKDMKIQELNTFSEREVAAERKLALKERRNFFIFRHRLANDEIRTVEVFSVPYIFDEKTLLYSIVTDVTAFQISEDSIQHYQNALEHTVDDQAEEIRKIGLQLNYGLIVVVLILSLSIVVLMRNKYKKLAIEKALIIERNRLQEIIQVTNVGTWEWNSSTDEITFNEYWAALIKRKSKDLKPLTFDSWFKLVHPKDLQEFKYVINQIFAHQRTKYHLEFRMLDKSGSWVWVSSRGRVVEWSNKGEVIRITGIHRDISERKKSEEELQARAQHDPLTGLPNRSVLLDRCNVLIASAKRNRSSFALLFIDLDRFKPVNDKFGHLAGDIVLKEIAHRLLLCVRDSDTVARYGGDEFVILLGNIKDQKGTEKMLSKIKSRLSQSINIIDDERVEVSCSIGVSIYPYDGLIPESLINVADGAMYEDKKEQYKEKTHPRLVQ